MPGAIETGTLKAPVRPAFARDAHQPDPSDRTVGRTSRFRPEDGWPQAD
jgi:hypothetical protein